MSTFIEYTVPEWRGLNMRTLKVDEAFFILRNFYNESTYLYSLSDECYTCPYTLTKTLHKHKENDILILNVARGWQFQILTSNVGVYSFKNNTALCEFANSDLKEFGVYNLTVTEQGECYLKVDKEGVEIYFGLASAFLLIFLCAILLRIGISIYKYYSHDPEATVAEDVKTNKRIRSLDTFRGFAIALMIFVNSGGGSYWWIEHATWNGLHLADTVFPAFLWIMGACLAISIRSQLAKGHSKKYIYQRIFMRSLKLFFIGLCLNSINGPTFENLRIMGVLQRFGIAYLICGIIHTIFYHPESATPQETWQRKIIDILSLKNEFITMFLLILIHIGIVFFLPVSGCPSGYLGPGGKHSYAQYPKCVGGAIGFIDKQVLGLSHIYQHSTARYVYESNAFDPEGLGGCLLTIVQVILGLEMGITFLIYSDWQARFKRWILWSIGLASISAVLCGFSQEAGYIPLNKNLWSLSFVLLTSAICFFVFTVLYLVIDVKCLWNGSPFLEAGMNSIILYVGHTILHKMLPFHWRLETMNTHFTLFLESAWNTFLWICIALYLHSKQIYYNL